MNAYKALDTRGELNVRHYEQCLFERAETYATKHMTYPPSLLEKSIKGYALCQFTVSREGNVTNAHILQYSHPKFAEEALRIVKGMPKYLPAMSESRPVACNYVLYIPFRPSVAQKQ